MKIPAEVEAAAKRFQDAAKICGREDPSKWPEATICDAVTLACHFAARLPLIKRTVEALREMVGKCGACDGSAVINGGFIGINGLIPCPECSSARSLLLAWEAGHND